MTRKDPPNMDMMGYHEKKAKTAPDIKEEGKGKNVKEIDEKWTEKHQPQPKDDRPFSERVKNSVSKSEKDKEKDKDDPDKDK